MFRRKSSWCKRPRFYGRLFLERLESRLAPATVNWNVDADGDWNNSANWSTGNVPGATDTAVIDRAVPVTITYAGGSSSVLSLNSNANLVIASGSFQVTGGASEVSGTFSMGAGASLSVTGSGTTFIADGATTINTANLYVSGGATLTLPDLTSYSGGSGATLEATGTGSVLDLSHITTFAGGNGLVNVAAVGGGRVDLSGVTAITAGNTQLVGDGADSLLDVSQLASLGDPNYDFYLYATNGGTVRLAPGVTVTRTAVVFDAGST